MPDERFKAFQALAPIPSPPSAWSWEALMAEALKEADLAFAEREVPVGAVIINKKGDIISRAHNINIQTFNPCAHAEIIALQKAGVCLSSTKLTGCTLVVTLEPCLMCSAAIGLSCLDGVVFGAFDKQAGAIVSTNDFISLPANTKNIWYLGGISATPCRALLQDFFTSLRA